MCKFSKLFNIQYYNYTPTPKVKGISSTLGNTSGPIPELEVQEPMFSNRYQHTGSTKKNAGISNTCNSGMTTDMTMLVFVM
jgi:hypothetical protein